MKGQKSEWFTSSGSFERNIKDSPDKSGTAKSGQSTYPKQVLQQVGLVCQLILGIAVIAVALMGLIQPLWLSTSLILISCISVLAGAGFLYLTSSKRYDPNALLRSAMRRVMESQN